MAMASVSISSPGKETYLSPDGDRCTVRHHLRFQIPLEVIQLEGAPVEGVKGAYHEWSRERLGDTDGAHRPRLLQRSAGDLYFTGAERLYLEADQPWIGQCGTVSGGVLQAHRLVVCLLHPDDHWCFSSSARKRKGGMGMYLGIGLALSFAYIMFQTISATFAINAGFPPMLAAWLPNIVFAVIAFLCYLKAPN